MEAFSRRALLIGSVGIVLAACSHGFIDNTLYSIGVSGEANRVTIVDAPDDTYASYALVVDSPKGIGQATVAWWGDSSPHPLLVQLNLRGLESFTIQWANNVVMVAVNSTDGSITQSVQIENGEQTTIDATSPFWMELTMPSQDNSAFVVKEPAALTQDGPRVWSISWVDFYR